MKLTINQEKIKNQEEAGKGPYLKKTLFYHKCPDLEQDCPRGAFQFRAEFCPKTGANLRLIFFQRCFFLHRLKSLSLNRLQHVGQPQFLIARNFIWSCCRRCCDDPASTWSYKEIFCVNLRYDKIQSDKNYVTPFN